MVCQRATPAGWVRFLISFQIGVVKKCRHGAQSGLATDHAPCHHWEEKCVAG